MSEGVAAILERLAQLGFHTHKGGLAPFGETLPLVAGVAWDTETAQLALVAEMEEGSNLDEWRQLLFATAGLRHDLAGDRPAAFGSPVVLAVVDDRGWRCLRDLAEDLAANYVLFNRVDLNLVRLGDIANTERLDDALAPLLPRCRSMRDQEISRADVKQFWQMLRTEVAGVASGLDAVFGPYRERVGAAVADELVADSERAPELSSPSPLRRVSIENFRSIREAEITFEPVTIVSGPNGGGKSSVLEAMELLWAGTSQRKPAGVPADEYQRHLPRNGTGRFRIVSEEHEVTAVAEPPTGELVRCVLTHESVAGLVSQSPEERYAALLATTGLEMPDLTARAQALLDDAKRAADAALTAAGLPTLPRRNSIAVKHLRASLASGFSRRIVQAHELVGAEETLVAASTSAYSLRTWPRDEHATAAAIRAETVIAGLLDGSVVADEVEQALDEARTQVEALVGARREVLSPLRRCLGFLHGPVARPAPAPPKASEPTPVPQELAVRWLSHVHAVRDAASRFREDAEAVVDATWTVRLRDYADALETAATSAPVRELEEFGRRALPSRPTSAPQTIPGEVFAAAGFKSVPTDTAAIARPMERLVALLEQQIDALERLSRDLEVHPARRFRAHAETVLSALCRFELARQMRDSGPILDASEKLVGELLQRRLAPLVRELVASIVRFEWYFEPLLVPEEGRKVILGGLATSQPNLDARLLLNSAERTAVGIAWFLALHYLQPAGRQRVLVLDDPTSAFDAPNQAGLISTLRAFVRLVRPDQLVIATHDDPVAAVLSEELASVDGWPAQSLRLRCQRNSSDSTVVKPEPSYGPSCSIAEEVEQLGIGKAPMPH